MKTEYEPPLLGRTGRVFLYCISLSLCCILTGVVLDGCASVSVYPDLGSASVRYGHDAAETPERNEIQQLEEQWGVKVSGVRLTAAGYMLDFRYTIKDPEKAAPLVTRKIKPFLVDSESGAELIVPTPPKVGALRSNSRNALPIADRCYFILFANPGGLVKQGNRVSVVIGDFRVDDLIVE